MLGWLADPLWRGTGDSLSDLGSLASALHADGESTVAVVGSSGNLLQSNAGALVDKHQLVVRVNTAPTEGFEVDVGSSTSMQLIEYHTWSCIAFRACCVWNETASACPPRSCPNLHGTLEMPGNKRDCNNETMPRERLTQLQRSRGLLLFANHIGSRWDNRSAPQWRERLSRTCLAVHACVPGRYAFLSPTWQDEVRTWSRQAC